MQRRCWRTHVSPARFQSSPAPKGRCNSSSRNRSAGRSRFQSSPAPKGRCNQWKRRAAAAIDVSILTGPEGPMQLFVWGILCHTRQFQSSPAPKGRCNRQAPAPENPVQPFQSSPAPKGRCNSSSDRGRLNPQCFFPHRPRRADATLYAAYRPHHSGVFNPHRPRRANATHRRRCERCHQVVSILTGPEGPMRP